MTNSQAHNGYLTSRYLHEFRIIQMVGQLPTVVYLIQYRPEGGTEWKLFENIHNGQYQYTDIKEAEKIVKQLKQNDEYLVIKEF